MEVRVRNGQQPEFRVAHRLLVGFAAPHFRFASTKRDPRGYSKGCLD
jgi:hypothetical protein